MWFQQQSPTARPPPLQQPPSFFTIQFICLTLFGLANGCFRQSKPPPPPPLPPTTTTTTTKRPMLGQTTEGPSVSHRLPCRPTEEQFVRCLNGGRCEVVILQNIRNPTCSCQGGWTGKRCHEKDIWKFLQIRQAHMRTANIAAGVSFSILVVFVVLLAIFVYIRYRRKRWLQRNREFEATAEELYRRPFSKRSSIVETFSRPSSFRRSAADNRNVSHDRTPGALELNGSEKIDIERYPAYRERHSPTRSNGSMLAEPETFDDSRSDIT